MNAIIQGRMRFVVSIVLVLLAVVVLLFVFLSRRQGKGLTGSLPVIKTQEVQGSLVSGFPADVPVYQGAVIKSSYVGTQGVNKVYGAEWTVNEINGHSVDKTSVREVMHWYEDEAFPESWIFDIPLQQSGDTKDPSKIWLTVSKNGIALTLTAERSDPAGPVVITAFIVPK